MMDNYRADEALINQLRLRLLSRSKGKDSFQCSDAIRADLQAVLAKYPDTRICAGCKQPWAKCYCAELW